MEQQQQRLFSTLAQYARLYHKPITLEELVHGLPLQAGHAAPELFSCSNLIDNFSRAAKRAGLSASLKQRPLEEISPLTLPAILALNDGSGCIVESIDIDNGRCRIISDPDDDALRDVDLDTLRQQYSGYVFFVARRFDYHQRNKPVLKSSGGHWFWSTLKISRPIYMDVLKASLLVNLFVLAMPLFTRNVYNRVIPNNATETLWALGIGVIVVIVLDTILKFLRTYFVELAAKKSDIIIISKLYEKVLDLDMTQAPRNIGSFAVNFREFDSVRNFLTSSVTLALVDLPFTVLFLVVIYYLAGPLVVVPCVMMTLLFLYAMFIKKPLFDAIYASFSAAARKNSLLIEMLAGIKDIKFLNAAGLFQWRWENTVAELAELGIKTRMLSASLSTVTGMLIQLNSVLVVIYGVYLIGEHQLTMGGLIAVSILSGRTIAPIGQVVALLSNYEQTRVAYESIDEIMNKVSEHHSGSDFIQKTSVCGDVTFNGVSFTYPEAEQPALKNITCSFKAGEKVGIVGRTGSGKSTMLKLILGLYRPQEGNLLVDSVDVAQISPVFLRKNASYVPQDFTLMAGSLRENLTFKVPYAAGEALLAAARTGALEGFIANHPRGFDAWVDERGANLSGGQKQGVAIARAFIEDAPLVLLDEPTNAMDGTTEAQVKQQLKQRIADKTTFLVTHKNTMLDLVDRVLVLDGGALVFDGSRSEFFQRFSK